MKLALFLLLLVLAPGAFAGSQNERPFLEDMKTVLPLVPPGWALARNYRAPEFAGIDDKVSALAGSYELVPLAGGATAVVLMLETAAAKPPLQRKLLVALKEAGEAPRVLFENADFPPPAESGADPFGRILAHGTGHFSVSFSAGEPGDWQFTFRFEARGTEFALAGQTELRGDPRTKAWTRTETDFESGAVITSTGGYTAKGQETVGPTRRSTIAVQPLRLLKSLQRLTP